MCGGGGGDGGAAEREDRRQRKQNTAISKVNRLFGVKSESAPKPQESDYRTRYNRKSGYEYGPVDQAAYQKALSEWQAAEASNQQETAANKTAREALYTKAKGDVTDYFTNDLDQQRTDAERNARFNLARRGVTGGSSDLDVMGSQLKDYNKAVLKIGNRADATGSQLRSADEQSRLNLISRVGAGMSGNAAIQTANQAMQNNLSNANANALAQSLGRVFSDYGLVVQQQAQNNGAAKGYFGSTYLGNPGGYSGSSS